MVRRLVLGCGSLGHAIVVALADSRGDLSVVDPDPERVETLRNEGIPAQTGDPTDAESASTDGEVETVFVAGDDPDGNLAAAEVARSVHPAASIVAYTGVDSDAETRRAIETVADRTVHPGVSVADAIVDLIEDQRGSRLHRLLATLRGVSGRLGVFTHDNPDPDAIASAVALRELARSVGTESDVCYFGDITHQENRAFVNVLDLDLLNPGVEAFDPDAFDAFALVDHSRPGINDQLPVDVEPVVVIDHHPPRAAVAGRFVDLRSDVGATSTLLTDYYRTRGAEIDTAVATALLFGIRVDTRNFGREITQADFDAVAYLTDHVDMDVLGRIESPSVSAETFAVLANAIRNRDLRGEILATSAGWTSDRDALAQAADMLLDMEGVSTVLVLGLIEETDTVAASARTRGIDLDIGEALRLAYDQIGSAGGHTDMAGAQIPLGILGAIEDGSGSLEDVIGAVLIDRFFEVLEEEEGLAPRTQTGPFGETTTVDESTADEVDSSGAEDDDVPPERQDFFYRDSLL